MRKIFIDAGHNPQGWNTGAEGNGMREQDIVYEVSKLLADILENDFIVKLSRPTEDTILGTNNDTAINNRWQMSNAWGTDYFISIHTNAFKKDMATGAETFYFRDDAFNFAKTIQDTYSKEMNIRNRRTEYRGNLAVIRHTNHPSILLELGFIDHKEDSLMLNTKRLEMAKAIAKGIYKYLGVSQTEKIIEKEKIKEEQYMRYNNINEVPDWGKSTIEKLIRLEMLNGNGEGLNLTEDMIRILVINDRAGLYGEYTAQCCVSIPVKYTTEEIDLLEKIVHA